MLCGLSRGFGGGRAVCGAEMDVAEVHGLVHADVARLQQVEDGEEGDDRFQPRLAVGDETIEGDAAAVADGIEHSVPPLDDIDEGAVEPLRWWRRRQAFQRLR